MVRFETRFDEEVTSELNKVTLNRMRVVFGIISAIFIMLGLIFVVGAFLYDEVDVESLCLAVIYLLLGIFLFPLTKLLTNTIQKKINKSMSILSKDTIENFEFTEDKITIETIKGDTYHGTVEAKYDYIYKVVETESAYLLYISKMQSHVVKKKYLAEGTFEELNKYISSKFNDVRANKNGIVYKRFKKETIKK